MIVDLDRLRIIIGFLVIAMSLVNCKNHQTIEYEKIEHGVTKRYIETDLDTIINYVIYRENGWKETEYFKRNDGTLHGKQTTYWYNDTIKEAEIFWVNGKVKRINYHNQTGELFQVEEFKKDDFKSANESK